MGLARPNIILSRVHRSPGTEMAMNKKAALFAHSRFAYEFKENIEKEKCDIVKKTFAKQCDKFSDGYQARI